MGLLAKLLGRLGYVPKAAPVGSRVAQARYVAVQGTTGVSHPGITVNELEYSWRHPILFANYNHIATAAMGVPLLVQRMVPSEETKAQVRFISAATAAHCQKRFAQYPMAQRAAWLRTKGLDAEDVPDSHPLRVLLDMVNPRATWRELIYQTTFDLEATGNAYWELVGGAKGRQPTELWRIRPDRMKVLPDERNVVGGYVYTIAGEELRFDADEVLHFRYPHPMNDYYGLSKADVLEWPLKADWNRLQYSNKFFENGAQLNGIIVPKGEGFINKDELQRLIDQFNEKHRGVENMGKIAVLQDYEFQQTGVSPKDADYLGMAARHDTEISAVVGRPTQLFKAENVNRANYEAALLQFWSDTMIPRLSMVAGQVNEFLAPRFGEDIATAFDTSVVKVLAEEETSVVEREGKLFDFGATSLDEFRAAAGYDPLPDGAGERYKRNAGVRFVTLDEDLEPEPEPEPVAPPFGNAPEDEEPDPEDEADTGGEQAAPPEQPKSRGLFAELFKRKPQARKSMQFGSEVHKAAIASWEDRVAPHEARLEKAVTAWAHDLEDGVLSRLDAQKSFKATAPDPLGVLFDEDEAGKALYKVVQDVSIEAAIAEGAHVLAEIGIEGLIFDPKNPLVLAHIAAKELLVKTVATDLHEALRKIISNEVGRGQPIEQIRKRIEERFTDLYDWQARRIAQTETIGAMNVGSMAAIEQTGLKKIWVATLDDRVRDSHAGAMEDGAIPTDAVFSNGLRHPGDPDGPAEEVINCRCALAPVAEDEE